MATTTPNFGWTVPTSTDLVKDGATAIETLGDSIDASFVDLKGGTTGQVLSKTSGTDLDFTWTTMASGAFTFAAWTPTYTNLTVGNGTVTSRYGQSGKFVFFYWRLVLGSTSSIGSAPKITVPVTALNINPVGSAYYLDAATAEFIGQTRFFDTSNLQLIAPQSGTNSSAGLSSGFPFTWTTSDEIRFTIVYEAA